MSIEIRATLDEPITEKWLRENGFKWEEPFGGGKHWTLWVSDAAATADASMIDGDSLGIELNQLAGTTANQPWHCWIRSDICGRYTRFIHVRYIKTRAEVVKLIEAMVGYPFNPADAMYGSLRHPKRAEAMRKYQEELHVRQAVAWGGRVLSQTGADPDKREKLHP